MIRLLRRLWECVVVGFDTARIHWRQQETFDEIIRMGREAQERLKDGEED